MRHDLAPDIRMTGCVSKKSFTQSYGKWIISIFKLPGHEKNLLNLIPRLKKKEFKSVFMVSRIFLSSGQYNGEQQPDEQQAEKINKETFALY